MRPNLRPLARGREDGWTLIELSVASAIMVAVLGIFGSILVSAQRSITGETDRSSTNDQARQAVEQIDREARSGNLLYSPATESLPNYSMRIFSQNNQVPRCVQWAVMNRQLLRRSWTPSNGVPLQPGAVSAWRVVADGIVNVERSTPAFALSTYTSPGGRTMDIVILVNTNYTRHPEATVRLEQSITGRNTTRSSEVNACDPAPSIS